MLLSEMTSRRMGRLSSSVLPPDASPFEAMRSIIGASLRKRYELPQRTPTYIDILLNELDGGDEAGSDPD